MKKKWITPELMLLGTDSLKAKHKGSNEHAYSHTAPNPMLPGNYIFYKGGVKVATAVSYKLSEVLS